MRLFSPIFPVLLVAFSLAFLAPGSQASEGQIDYLKVAREFADCMITHGRDRYGEVHSPLFASALTRQPEPRLTPVPRFAPGDVTAVEERQAAVKSRWPARSFTAFVEFDFKKCTNYPASLGSQNLYRVTLSGCDPLEDRRLYQLLFDLTRITGERKYRNEAEKALRWWFENTQGPTGLYPWGDHLGWDFNYEMPTYFEGTSRLLHEATFHDIKDDPPFLYLLAAVPAKRSNEMSVLDNYAQGLWNMHFWDKERVIYSGQGDYEGEDNQVGNPGGSPANLAAYLRIWTMTYDKTRQPAIRIHMDNILNRVLDMALARIEKHGFYPSDFTPELEGGRAVKSNESLRLVHHCIDMADQLDQVSSSIAAKMRKLARIQLERKGFERVRIAVKLYRKTGEFAHLEGELPPTIPPEVVIQDLSDRHLPEDHARAIRQNLQHYERYGDRKYVDAAEAYARAAHGMFCDKKSPLPRALATGVSLETPEGKEFPDFYFRGAELMHAFVLLGEKMARNQ